MDRSLALEIDNTAALSSLEVASKAYYNLSESPMAKVMGHGRAADFET